MIVIIINDVDGDVDCYDGDGDVDDDDGDDG